MKLRSYSDLWKFDPAVHKFVMEASTGYTKYPMEQGVPRRIHEFGIRPKFIYLVRNPYDRITSNIAFMQRGRQWDRDVDRPELIAVSNYYLQLEQYRRYFPRDDILVLDFDELQQRPGSVFTKACEFLRINPDLRPERFGVVHRTRVEGRLSRVLRASGIYGLFRRGLPKAAKKPGRKLLRLLSRWERRALTSEERERIRMELFRPMLDLQEHYGVDVRKWGFGG